jgi:hypothetical protein
MLEADLYSFISTNQSVLAALSQTNAVWLGMIPQGQPDSPAVVIQNTYTETQYGADGINNVLKKRIQIDSYHSNYQTCLIISNTVRDLLKNLTGALANTNVLSCMLNHDMDMPDEPGAADYVFRRMIEFDIFHIELGTPQAVSPNLPAPPNTANAAYLQGIPIDPTTPTSGEALVFNGSEWTPTSGGAGTNATELQGVNVSSTAPSDGQVLMYVAAQNKWVPVSLIDCN